MLFTKFFPIAVQISIAYPHNYTMKAFSNNNNIAKVFAIFVIDNMLKVIKETKEITFKTLQ